MKTCFWVPGLLGSGLSTTGQNGEGIWAFPEQLAKGKFELLWLDSDGVSPKPGHGEQLEQHGIIREYYGATETVLKREMGAEGYQVISFGYDWRLKIRTEGERLAGLIRNNATPTEPCVIAAHSQGGLTARAAWSSLVASNETALCRRIVTLGTPHAGSYSPMLVWFNDDEIVDQLNAVNRYVGYGLLGPVNPFFHRCDADEIRQITASWPSFYEMLPLLDGSFFKALDPHRIKVFGATYYENKVNVSQQWLDYARLDFQPWLMSAASNPPPWVLTCCAGTGIPTASTLKPIFASPGPGFYCLFYNGDGRVDTYSALWPDAPRHSRNARHSDMPELFDDNGVLTWLLLEVRNPTPPPPPPTPAPTGVLAVQNSLPNHIGGPPFNLKPTGGVGAMDC